VGRVHIDLLLRKPYIMNQSVPFEERAPDIGLMTGLMTFVDGVVLHVKRSFTLRPEMIVILTFGFHHEKKEIFFRYDYAPRPDVKGCSTYPSHKDAQEGI